MVDLVCLSSDPEESFSSMLDKYQLALKERVPKIKPSSSMKLNLKWLNKEIKQLISKKYALYCKMRAGPKGNLRQRCQESGRQLYLHALNTRVTWYLNPN